MRESAFREADKTAVRRSMTRASRPTKQVARLARLLIEQAKHGMFAERNSFLSQVNEQAVRLVGQKNLFIENRIKKEYRNDKIVRIKDKRSGRSETDGQIKGLS